MFDALTSIRSSRDLLTKARAETGADRSLVLEQRHLPFGHQIDDTLDHRVASGLQELLRQMSGSAGKGNGSASSVAEGGVAAEGTALVVQQRSIIASAVSDPTHPNTASKASAIIWCELDARG
ncbi:MAG: hypothetical protein ABW179_01565 [Methylobacterium sp.]